MNEILSSTDFNKGYRLIDRVLQKIAKNRGQRFCEEVALATVEEYQNAPDKSEFDLGVLYGAYEYLPEYIY